MRKLLTVLLLSCIGASQANGQLITGASPDFTETHAYLTQIPAMPVEDIAGNKSTLKEYIRSNQLHPGKPILIITWFTFCGGCRRHVNSMAEKGFGDKYNLVTLLLKIGSNEKDKNFDLKAIVGNGSKEHDWHKFLNLTSTDSLAARYLYNGVSTPLYIFADKDMKVYSTFVSLDNEMVQVADKMMRHLDDFSGTFTPGIRWYDEAGYPVPSGAEEAVRYTHMYPKDGKIIHISGSRIDSSKVTGQYVKGDSLYLADGRWQVYDEKGNLAQTNIYHLGGVAETRRSTHPNGKPAAIIPVDGIARNFDENGKLTLEGPMKNGLGEGVFRLFEDGVLTTEISLKGGQYDGPWKVYEDGKLVSVTHYKNGKKVKEK